MNGTLLWQTDLGDKSMRNTFGEGSTPALHGNRVVVVWDHTAGSFIAVLDARTGKEIWRQKREEIDTWAMLPVREQDGRAQVIVPGMNRVQSYDLETGAVVWHAAGLTMNPIPSPVADETFVYLMSGFRGNNLKAIRLAGAKGISPEPRRHLDARSRHPLRAVAAPVRRHPLFPEVQQRAPVGVPRAHGKAALPGAASPAGARSVRLAGRRRGPGLHSVARRDHGGPEARPAFEIVAENKLSDGFDASPALAGREIYLRGYKNLYCIAE